MRNRRDRWLAALGCLAAVACSSKSNNSGGAAGTDVSASSGTGASGAGGATAAPAGVGATSAAGASGRAAGTSGKGSSATAGTPAGGSAATGGTPATGASGMGGSAGSNGAAGGSASGTQSVLQFHNHATRDGVYTQSTFTRAAAAMLHRDATFMATMSGPTYAQPLYFEGGPGGKDLVIVATENNEVTAFSAADGSQVWRKSIAPAGPAGGGGSGCALGNISPLGVTGTPVIDAASRTLFLDAMTTNAAHQIFALSLDDGSTKTGWPVDVSTVKAGSLSFNSPAENQRGALIILNGTLYAPYGGHYGDCGDYHGWVVGVPIANPKAAIGWATRASAGGVWASSGLASDGTSVFAATGNTMASPPGNILPAFSSPASWSDGEAIIRLPPDLNFAAGNKDFFAAQNWAALDNADNDVGGSGVVLFSAPGATPSELAIAFGKDGTAYLVDRANLGGMGGQLGSVQTVSTDQIMQAAVAYTTPTGTFVTIRAGGIGCPSGGGALTALKVAAAAPPTLSVAWCAGGASTGSPMVTTTDGTNESIVWYVSGTKLVGYNGETGAPVFNGGAAGDAVSSADKWQTPIAAKGRIFFASSNQLYAFTL